MLIYILQYTKMYSLLYIIIAFMHYHVKEKEVEKIHIVSSLFLIHITARSISCRRVLILIFIYNGYRENAEKAKHIYIIFPFAIVIMQNAP